MLYDLILKNAEVITLNPAEDVVSWVGVRDGKISGMGNCDDVPEEGAQIIDLEGKTVIPGLFDAHVHVMPTGYFLNSVNLLETKSLKEVLALLEEECLKAPKDEWIFGVGFMSQNMDESRFPDRYELDSISHGHPVMVSAQTLHGATLNTQAMEGVEIPNVAGVGRDVEGNLNGVLLSDDAAFPVMSSIFAKLPEEKLFSFIKDCSAYAAQKGVTTMIGLLGQFVQGDVDVDLVLKKRAELPVNIEIFYQTWDLERVKKLGLPRIGGCLTLDGAGFEYTMALAEPYPQHPERRGFLIHTDEEIYALLSEAHRQDIQCAFHALGDRAIDQLIYVFKQVIGEQGQKDLRHRIEHFSLPEDRHMDLLAQMGLVASMQPAFAGLWGQPKGGYYELLLGRKRADRMEVFPEIIKRGGMICGGSDSPVTLIDPLFGIACCVNNVDPRRNISVTDALKIFTLNSAYSVSLEERKGSIELGKDADFTIINKNPYQWASSQEIYDMKAVMTIKAGIITYEE